MSLLRIGAVALLAVLDFAATPLCAQTASAPLSAEAADWAARHVKPVRPGMGAPDFPIRHPDGRMGNLLEYKGRPAVVTLWKSDCPICRREMPILDRLAADMASEGVAFAPLTLDMDMARANFAFQDWGVRSLPAIQDVDRVNGTFFALGVQNSMSIATPTTYILDKAGQIRGTVWGAGDWDSPGAKAWLRALAAEPG